MNPSRAAEAPRDVTPGGIPGAIANVAAFEDADGTLRLLLFGNVDIAGYAMPSPGFLRGLGNGPRAALIRLSPSSGILAAYATTIDNATNDPVYFAANLAP